MAQIPEQIGHYRIVSEIGRGGQGVVYLARDLKLGRDVAIKTLRRSSLTAEDMERLQREARIASRLDHPGICPIYDIGDHDGEPYLVMRFVRGTTLLAKLDQLRHEAGVHFTFVDVLDTAIREDESGRGAEPDTRDTVPPGRTMPEGKDLAAVLRLVEHVARALHEAHEAEVIHRDVKPGNIIVTPDGQPVLVDFGIATMPRGDTPSVTETGKTPGTPPYMSPEQTLGGRITLDRRTDVYSLGVTLYECLTLRLPFDEHTQVARQIMFVKLPDPRKINPAITKDLKTVLEAALEKDRDRRYATAADFADDLRRVREHEPIRARPAGPFLRFARWSRRNPVVAASLAAIIVTLAVTLAMTLYALGEAQDARDAERVQREALGDALSLSEPLADLKLAIDLDPWADRLWPADERVARGPDGMEGWLEEAGALLARRDANERALRELEAGGGSWSAAERARRIRVRRELLARHALLPPKVEDMKKRLARASTIAMRTIEQHRGAWGETAAALAADPRFASMRPLKPQLGLIPLGRNEAGLFEFALAETGDPPARIAGSRPMEIMIETAAVLVLMPGGTLRFDPEPAPDGRRASEDDLLPADVGPHFLGKHEITQAQWRRVMNDNPAVAQPGRTIKAPVSERHPVESVSWNQCAEFCKRLGCRLPAQDEWELAARPKPDAEWGDFDDAAKLEGRENLADLDYEDYTKRPAAVKWHDGFPLHAPVGRYRANGLGIHDMLGNVSEWCSDRWSRPRIASAASRPTPDPSGEDRRAVRGSNWQFGTKEARCRWFVGYVPEATQPNLGLRIARSIDR
jgi:serine/threonine protein kinase/formylglycine-generating enzyme required for sulfatase activity